MADRLPILEQREDVTRVELRAIAVQAAAVVFLEVQVAFRAGLEGLGKRLYSSMWDWRRIELVHITSEV